jgi:hypothetical protein
MTILVLAGLSVATTPRRFNRVCFQTKMDDAHILLAAFSQTPSEQDAIAAAIRACSH